MQVPNTRTGLAIETNLIKKVMWTYFRRIPEPLKEELQQATIEHLLRRAKNRGDEIDPRGYWREVRQCMIDAYREQIQFSDVKVNKRFISQVRDEEFDPEKSEGCFEAKQHASLEAAEQVRIGLEALNDQEKDFFLRVYAKGLTQKDIAQEEGLTPGRVSQVVLSAKEKAKNRINWTRIQEENNGRRS